MARGKKASSLDLPLPTTLQVAANGSKRDCIIHAIRDAITKKLLTADSSLPSSRTLADRWKVSRGTVEAAFDRLFSEGYIVRVHGSGTRVSPAIPDTFRASSPRNPIAADVSTGQKDTQESKSLAIHEQYSVRPGVPFVARLPAPELLEGSYWEKHSTNAVKSEATTDLNSTPLQGIDSLRHQIAMYLGAFRGLSCRAEDIFITNGIRHSIDSIARLILKAKSKATVEDPGYLPACDIFELAGATVVHVPIDEDGMRVDDLVKQRNVSLVYVTPAHQSPLGVTMSVDRRRKLLEWASDNQAWIIEDDYDGEFSYQTAPLPALKSDDKNDRVIYCSSFNKTVFTGLRVGFMVVPAALRPKMLTLWQTVGTPIRATTQRALTSFMASGDFSNHLHRSRLAYQQRRDALLRELERHASGKFEVIGDHAGFHFVVRIGPGADEQGVIQEAAAIGITLQSLQAFCHAIDFGPAFVIGYAALSMTQAKYFGKELGLLLDRMTQPIESESPRNRGLRAG
jgi:GntR family transcriptional regulator / MocR family aminotransferase